MGVQCEISGYFGSGQTWTLPDAYETTLDVYPPLRASRSRRVYPSGRADRASSAATNYALQLGATDLEYEVTRVKSPVIGRDMNPMGRGDGAYYANGGNLPFGASLAVRGAKPWFLGEIAYGFGNAVNNETRRADRIPRPRFQICEMWLPRYEDMTPEEIAALCWGAGDGLVLCICPCEGASSGKLYGWLRIMKHCDKPKKCEPFTFEARDWAYCGLGVCKGTSIPCCIVPWKKRFEKTYGNKVYTKKGEVCR